MAEVLRVAEYTRYPGPRYRTDGPFSASEFREEWLEPRLKKAIARNDVLTVILDDVSGYGSSFLEESFGGLVRAGFSGDQLERHLSILAKTTRFQHHRLRALQYMREALSQQAHPRARLTG